MRRSRLLLAALPLLLISVSGCEGDNAIEEEPASLVVSLVEALPLVPIGVPLADATGLPEPTEVLQSFDVPGGTDYIYTVESGRIMATTLNGLIQRVIYQTPLRHDTVLRDERNQRFLTEYAEGMSWREDPADDSSILYERSDGEVFALWVSDVDYVTVETRELREALNPVR